MLRRAIHNLSVMFCQELQGDILSGIFQPEILANAPHGPYDANQSAPVVVEPNIAVSDVDSTTMSAN